MLGRQRSTQRRVVKPPGNEDALTRDIVTIASRYGRYGYRRVTALLHALGWRVDHKRVERIWRREDLKVPERAAQAREALALGRLMRPVEAAGQKPRPVARLRGDKDL